MLRFKAFVSAFLVSVFLCSGAAAAEKKTVFVIESYHGEYAWDAGFKCGLEESLGTNYKLVYFEMDTKRLPADQFQKQADLAWAKYLALKPALVILADDAALKFMGPKFAEATLPVVFLGINNNPRNYFKEMPLNITGILERPLLMRSIANIQELLPKVKNILILFDNSLTSEIVRKEVFTDKSSLTMGAITVDLLLIGDWAAWQKAVNSAEGKYDACVVGLYQSIKDESGKQVLDEDVIKWTSRNTRIPNFAFWDFAVGPEKSIGGFIIYGKDMGIQASEIVKDILENGKTPASIHPISSDKGQFYYSKSQLLKWKITLPDKIASSAKYTD
jgi:ABC-type uncharacterized transport system substrate-binding protein